MKILAMSNAQFLARAFSYDRNNHFITSSAVGITLLWGVLVVVSTNGFHMNPCRGLLHRITGSSEFSLPLLFLKAKTVYHLICKFVKIRISVPRRLSLRIYDVLSRTSVVSRTG